jgi:hypothetical protein
MRATRTLFVIATAAGLFSAAACTSGTTADCSADAAGTPNQDPNAWCGVPAGGDASVGVPEGGPTETGAPDSGPAPDGGGSETGLPEVGLPEVGLPEVGLLDSPLG